MSNLKEELSKKHCAAIEDAEFEEIKHSAIYKLDFDKAAAACATITIQAMIDLLDGMKQDVVARRNQAHVNCLEERKESYNDCINIFENKLTDLKTILP